MIPVFFWAGVIQCTLDIATGLCHRVWGRCRQRGRYFCNDGGSSSIGDEVAIARAAAISKVAISNGHCNSFKFDVENTFQNLLSLWPKELFLDFFLHSLSSKWHGGSSFILVQLAVAWQGMGQGWIQFSTTTLVIVKSGIKKEKPLPFLKYRATWMAHLIRRKRYSNPHFSVPFLHLSVSKSMELSVLRITRGFFWH